MHQRAPLIALSLAFLAAGTARAQAPGATATGRIVGRVLDAESSQPVADVAIRLVDLPLPPLLTNATGAFQLTDIPRGIYEIEIQHIAYGVRRQLVNVPAGRTVQIEIRLNAQPLALDPIEVEVAVRNRSLERRGFYDRRRAGWGRYFTQEDFERSHIEHLLRRVPGMQLRPAGGSLTDLIPVLRRGGRNCVPRLYIDGMPIRFLGFGINTLVDSENIEAMEVYRGISTPGEFMGLEPRPCGAIVIWTKTANAP